jgi:solute carrier family 39 (zinc transporter), member 7
MDSFMRPLPFLAQSLISTVFISVVPIFFIYLLNLSVSAANRDSFTHILLSFALGGLLGDVFFHTLPHMNSGHSHDHGHTHTHTHDHGHDHSHSHGHDHGHHHSEEDMQKNLLIIVGIWMFFLLEKLVHTYFSTHDHGHSHSKSDDSSKKDKKNNKKVAKSSEEKEKELRFKSFAIISLFGDFIHNFTDGLSIGVSYVVDYKMGLVTTMAMFFHEIPHEVGDFAILFQLKYSVCQIVGLQFLTACGALAGTAVGSLLGQIYMNECLAFTTGGFLYFSINGLLTELKEVKTVGGLFACWISMSFGLYFMYVFALFE